MILILSLSNLAEIILYNSIKKTLEEVGVAYSKAVIDHICKFKGLSEREILTNCDLFEDSMYRLFGHGAMSIISRVKVAALRTSVMENKSDLTVPQILDPSLTLSDILMEIRRVEALNFIAKMSSYSHIAFLYSREDSLNKLLAEYLSPKDSQRILISETPEKYNYLELSASASYEELFKEAPDCSKEYVVSKIKDWMSKVGKVGEFGSRKPARLVEDDATWWIRNGHVRTLIAISQSIQNERLGTNSVLRAFNVSKLSFKELGTMRSIIRYHDFVIIDEPAITIYKLNKRSF